MSSFTDRIRARTRRHNERQARAQGPRNARREVAQELGLEVDEVAAIQTALGDQSLEPVVQTAGTAAYTAPEQLSDAASASATAEPPRAGQVLVAATATAAVEQLALHPAVADTLAPSVVGASKRVEFKSSNVRAAELGADGVVLVTFSDGEQYAYANFTPELFEEWQKASSAGSWFHHNVRKKPERHPGRKV